MRFITALSSALLLAGCLTAGPGGCGAAEAAAFHEIDHFGDHALAPQDHPYGICGATFTSDVDPEVVIGHYESVLPGAGWMIGQSETSPITDEGGNQIGAAINLGASKGSMTFSLGAELIHGPDTEPPTYNILVGESGS